MLQKLKLDWLTFVVVSVGYICSYTITSGLFVPLQKIFAPHLPIVFSVVFLPHGIRVLAVYFLGWRGLIYLLPSSYLMWATSVYGSSIDLTILSPVASLSVVYVAVRMVKTYSRSQNKGAFDFSWKECLVIAAIASVLNGVAHSMLYDNAVNWILIIGYSSGDMAGQIVLLLIMIALMRLNRKLSKFI